MYFFSQGICAGERRLFGARGREGVGSVQKVNSEPRVPNES